MSIRWRSRTEPVRDAVVEFREGALASPIDAHENQFNFRLEDMSRRVEEIQKRNADLEAKLAAQNETIRDHTLEKLTHLESRLALREDATKDETMRKLASLEMSLQPMKGADTVTMRQLERLEQKIEAATPNPHKTSALSTLERLERTPPTPEAPITRLSHEIPDEWLAERGRLYQLKSARDKARQ